jgi:hypothetical protein
VKDLSMPQRPKGISEKVNNWKLYKKWIVPVPLIFYLKDYAMFVKLVNDLEVSSSDSEDDERGNDAEYKVVFLRISW